MPQPYNLSNAADDLELQIVERAAQIQAKYRFYTSLVRFALFFLFALIAVVVIANAMRGHKPITNDSRSADQSQIIDYLTAALSDDVSAREKFVQGLQDVRTNGLAQTEKISAFAEYLRTAKESTPRALAVKAAPPNAMRLRQGRVMLYSKPEQGADVLSSVKNSLALQVTQRGEVWSEVTSFDGIPVWINRESAKRYGIGYVKIEADSTDIYSLPSKDGGEVLGALQKGEVARLIRTDEGWFRVWAPNNFSAWVKTEDLTGGE